jgi:hypothetical protein
MYPPNRKPRSSYNQVHKQQLFHWIGSHIDEQALASSAPGRRLDDRQRELYLGCLRGALSTGIWLQRPRVADEIGDGALRVSRPIACFTEWSLKESRPHMGRYGRLGLGFPKRFVLDCGGQPVTYVRDVPSKDRYTQAMLTIGEHLSGAPDEVRGAFEYVTHFVKRIKRKRPRSDRPPPPEREAVPKERGPSRELLLQRQYGETLQFLEEREWRVVFDPKLKGHRCGPASGRPPHCLPFRPGWDLFTVVLPDNLTVNMLLQDDELRRLLFPKGAPHVSLLSLDDIGTF